MATSTTLILRSSPNPPVFQKNTRECFFIALAFDTNFKGWSSARFFRRYLMALAMSLPGPACLVKHRGRTIPMRLLKLPCPLRPGKNDLTGRDARTLVDHGMVAEWLMAPDNNQPGRYNRRPAKVAAPNHVVGNAIRHGFQPPLPYGRVMISRR